MPYCLDCRTSFGSRGIQCRIDAAGEGRRFIQELNARLGLCRRLRRDLSARRGIDRRLRAYPRRVGHGRGRLLRQAGRSGDIVRRAHNRRRPYRAFGNRATGIPPLLARNGLGQVAGGYVGDRRRIR